MDVSPEDKQVKLTLDRNVSELEMIQIDLMSPFSLYPVCAIRTICGVAYYQNRLCRLHKRRSIRHSPNPFESMCN